MLATVGIAVGHLCPLSGVKLTSLPHRRMSVNDPKADRVTSIARFAVVDSVDLK